MADSLRILARGLSDVPGDPEALRVDSLIMEIDSLLTDTTSGPQDQQDAQKVTLLALRTTAMTYDFEQASEEGEWLRGFQTTRLSNNISSDYLRGLNISVTHELFEEAAAVTGEGGGDSGATRKFAPHLSSMNLGFSLSSQSWVFQTLGALFRRTPDEDAGSVVDAGGGARAEADALETNPTMDEARIIPGGTPSPGGGRQRGGGGRVGEWRANFSYSLQRPRDDTRPSNQMISSTLNFSPTEKWDVSWRTSYDVENGSFNDHLIRLTRDLHRWEAYFDFTQTATGNWSFRFEVALMDNDDLKFDYVQRSMKDTSGRRTF